MYKDECEWTHCFSQQYANRCLRYVFLIVVYQVSRNIISALRSVISLHFISQSDCSILSEVARMTFHGWSHGCRTMDSPQKLTNP